MYDIWVYATTKLLAEIPVMCTVPAVFLFIIYFAVGLSDSATQFVSYYLVLMMMV